MIKNVLENIGGVGIYGVVSICLFFAFFLAMLVWACRLKKAHLDSMSELPLTDGSSGTGVPPVRIGNQRLRPKGVTHGRDARATTLAALRKPAPPNVEQQS